MRKLFQIICHHSKILNKEGKERCCKYTDVVKSNTYNHIYYITLETILNVI